MGSFTSSENQHLERQLGNDFPPGEQLIGFENPNNICYSNVIIQTLFYVRPFRKAVLEYQMQGSDNLLYLTKMLFELIVNSKDKTGVVSTKKMMNYVKTKNRIFDGNYHQDCHEFYMWYLNELEEILNGKIKNNPQKNWLQKLFQGNQITRTICQTCKSSNIHVNIESEREETFYNLSIDLDPNCSLSYCIKKLSQEEQLRGQDQFFCDNCKGKQDATKTLLLSELPQSLVIHLKRFKYDERMGSMVKVATKIPFPFELRVQTNNSDEVKTKYYELTSIIIHLGQGIMYGHYICLIKINNLWFKFDDQSIQLYPPHDIYCVYGRNNAINQGCAYMLIYNEQ